MKLLFSSFVPTDKPADIQIQRCVTLIQTNIGAARQFYSKAHNYMNVQDTGEAKIMRFFFMKPRDSN